MSQQTQTRYRVGGMDCAACAGKIETAVRRIPGVTDASASATAGTLRVDHTDVAFTTVEAALRPLGYTLAPADTARSTAHHAPDHDHAGHDHTGHDHAAHDHGDHDHEHGQPDNHFDLGTGPWWQTPKARLALACGLALLAAYGVGLVAPVVGHWAFLVALWVGLVPIGRRAMAGAMAGTPFSIETLMTIAAVGAVIIGATEEAATVVLLFLVGELLEGVAASRARASIQGLSALVPKTALLVTGDTTRQVPATDLALDAIVMVRPGDRIPADGTIETGQGAIDESPVTGESVPVHRRVGDAVYAGTINASAVLTIRVTATASDNTIARIVRLVEEAQESKAPTARFIDRFSAWYTPGVLVVGALVAILPPLLLGQSWSEWIYKGLAILLIGCPCALVISTPAAIAAALSAGARRGLLLKGGAVLERLRDITTVALDKTGTLTQGKPAVTNILATTGSEADVLRLAAALEAGSSHPLALAILARAQADGITIPPATQSEALPGEGVSGEVDGKAILLLSPAAAAARTGLAPEFAAQLEAFAAAGKSVSVLLRDGQPLGALALRDEPRADALAGLDALRTLGIHTVMLTGDNARTAEAIGTDLSLEVRAGLLPADKQAIVRELQAQGQVVAKVGDGINDAPALAAADIGIAMGGGTDVALETADAAILHGRVADIAGMIGLSHATMRNIWQNIAVALGLKAVFLVTTILGITGLWPAILADTGATVLVTLNAMRLLAWRPR
ncbi:heavy metal translocating P-type ATPase [Devosia aquimaris]|uniref:heavy metal translocating P-type ATPase n=1 Tax=Devosia aquimaris TaxID=2866214 RepID=UPI001CD0C137|nr:heavy metal translocating P-type ATPase [Devosia sp. CJK-A8-3]